MKCTPKKFQPGFVVASAVGLATSVNYRCVYTWSARDEQIGSRLLKWACIEEDMVCSDFISLNNFV